VLQKVWRRGDGFAKPRQAEWIGPQAGEHAERSISGGRALLVVNEKRQRLTTGQRAGAPLYGRPASGGAFERPETTREPDFLIVSLESRGVSGSRDTQPADGDRVINRVGEHRATSRGGKYAQRHDGPGGIFRTGECEEVSKIGRRVTDLPGPIDVIGHRKAPS